MRNYNTWSNYPGFTLRQVKHSVQSRQRLSEILLQEIYNRTEAGKFGVTRRNCCLLTLQNP